MEWAVVSSGVSRKTQETTQLEGQRYSQGTGHQCGNCVKEHQRSLEFGQPLPKV